MAQGNAQVHDDSPPTRLDMLRFGRRVIDQQTTRQLALIDRWIADEERCERERRQGEQRRPPEPEWLIQFGLNRRGCWAAAKSGRCRPATRQQALDALRRQVPACVHCRPDNALGILD
ncbi:DUF6233 domain-containing protein [Streptomyces sp. NPDC001709]